MLRAVTQMMVLCSRCGAENTCSPARCTSDGWSGPSSPTSACTRPGNAADADLQGCAASSQHHSRTWRWPHCKPFTTKRVTTVRWLQHSTRHLSASCPAIMPPAAAAAATLTATVSSRAKRTMAASACCASPSSSTLQRMTDHHITTYFNNTEQRHLHKNPSQMQLPAPGDCINSLDCS